MLIAASAHLGRMEAAMNYLRRYLAQAPGVTVQSIISGQPNREVGRIANIVDGLRLAGLQET